MGRRRFRCRRVDLARGSARAGALALWTVLLTGCVASPHSSQSDAPDETAGPPGQSELRVGVEDAFPGLRFDLPIHLIQDPADLTRWFVVERAGRVKTFRTTDLSAVTEYADITDRVEAGCGEAGLLGMAFHPGYPATPEVFLSYTRPPCGGLVSVVARYTESGGVLDTAAGHEEALLTVAQPPFDNHKGGAIAFGPDGKLYYGLGDGGSAGDPVGNGQDLTMLLGVLLRIDVDAAPPQVPPDNPFVGATGGVRPEIFAYGLRNPWRFSFDRVTGELWLADVGQSAWEEVDRIVSGGNYGWNIMEGMHCYGATTCNQANLILPVAEYSHAEGGAISGGYMYRGNQVPGLTGTYVYGDFCSGKIWGLPVEGGMTQELVDTDLSIVGFGEGADGELYVLDYGSGGIYRIVPA